MPVCAARAAITVEAQTITVGSMTGMRKRSCGKKDESGQHDRQREEQQRGGRAAAARQPEQPVNASGASSAYGITDASRYLVECSVYEGPIGTNV